MLYIAKSNALDFKSYVNVKLLDELLMSVLVDVKPSIAFSGFSLLLPNDVIEHSYVVVDGKAN